jgi:hypothetical protein
LTELVEASFFVSSLSLSPEKKRLCFNAFVDIKEALSSKCVCMHEQLEEKRIENIIDHFLSFF